MISLGPRPQSQVAPVRADEIFGDGRHSHRPPGWRLQTLASCGVFAELFGASLGGGALLSSSGFVFGFAACLVAVISMSYFSCSTGHDGAGFLMRGVTLCLGLRFLSLVLIVVSLCTIDVAIKCSRNPRNCYVGRGHDAVGTEVCSRP